MLITVNCQFCGKEFMKSHTDIKRTNNKNFCSRSCAAKRRKTKPCNPPKERICGNCKKSYFCVKGHRSLKYCQDCHYIAKSKIGTIKVPRKTVRKGSSFYYTLDYKSLTIQDCLNTFYLKGKHKSQIYTYIRHFSRSWNRDKLELPCHICGYNKHVEMAHIRSISSFPLETTLGEVNSSENIVQLCPNCHWEFDKGLISIDGRVSDVKWGKRSESNAQLSDSYSLALSN